MTITKCAILEFRAKNPAIEESEPVAFFVGVVSAPRNEPNKIECGPTSARSSYK